MKETLTSLKIPQFVGIKFRKGEVRAMKQYLIMKVRRDLVRKLFELLII